MTFVLFLHLLACGESKTDTAEPSADTATEPSNEVSIEDTSEPVETFTISGSVVWEDDSPAAGAKIQVCADLCRRADVTADGTWSLSGLTSEVYIVLGFQQGDASIATTASLIDITADRDIGTMTLSPYATQETLVAGMHDYTLDNGLVLSFDSAALAPGLYSIGTTENISSLAIDSSKVPSDIDASNVVALWMIGDFDHHVESGISWRIDSDLGLAEGASVTLKYLDNEAHTWAELGTFSVSNGAIEGNGALPLLSSLMVVQN